MAQPKVGDRGTKLSMRVGDKQVDVAIRVARIETLTHHPANPRKHGPSNLAAIKQSLQAFGQRYPIVVNDQGQVLAGNGRLDVMRGLGWTEVMVAEADLSQADQLAFMVADNRSGELAEWDEEALATILKGMREMGALPRTGYDEEALNVLLGQLHQQTVPDIVEDQPPPADMDAACSRKGDLWQLGPHRLICGDSSKAEDVDRLLGGAVIHLLNTDPPYNVKVEPRSNNAIAAGLSSFSATTPKKLRAKDRRLANDFVSDGEFDRLLLAWFGNAARVMVPGAPFYIWAGYSNVINYPPALKASELYFSQAIIWVKDHPVLTRKDFMGNYEWCFYGWREGAAHRWYGPNNAQDVWSVKKVNPQGMVHLTEKPVELAARAMSYSSQAGDHVMDMFGGSGSTLMAAEQLGRVAFLLEMDVHYCDVIVKRWQNATKREAVLVGDGRTFSAVAAARAAGE